MHANPMFELIGSPDHDKSMQSAQVDKEFEEFKKKHSKDYHDNKEHEQRKTNFHHNYRYIDTCWRLYVTIYSLLLYIVFCYI